MKIDKSNRKSFYLRIIRKEGDIYADVPEWLEGKIKIDDNEEIVIEGSK